MSTSTSPAAAFQSKRNIRYVIFDMDGLLIDSERIYTEVTNSILEPHGAKMDWAIKAGCMGKSEKDAAEHLLSFFPNITLTQESYLERRNILQNKLWPTVQLLPGASKVVQHLRKHNIPIALATGTRRANYDMKTSHLKEVFGCFVTEGKEKVVCGDDERIGKGRGKPQPDIFLLAARELEIAVGTKEDCNIESGGVGGVSQEERELRSQGLVFEDAIPGVQAAKRAGMHCVWVPDPNLQTVDYAGIPPDQTLKTLEEFDPEEWGLPPYSSE